jgi:hypothetical protein
MIMNELVKMPPLYTEIMARYRVVFAGAAAVHPVVVYMQVDPAAAAAIDTGSQDVFHRCRYFFLPLQEQPQPEDFEVSSLAIQPLSPHSPHFFGLHRPSLVAPHFSHLKSAIFVSFGPDILLDPCSGSAPIFTKPIKLSSCIIYYY